jgi:tricorn protease
MKRHIRIIFSLAIVCLVFTAGPAPAQGTNDDPIRLMRRPDVNQGRIVFSYQGDLWLVPIEGGTARRLTVHLGTEDYPKFSPDGEWIAFTGDYNECQKAVFVIPSGGGAPTQLTYHTSGGHPVAWTPDSEQVVFSSTRESFVGFFKTLFSVPVEGGLPVQMELGKASFASFSPDGERIAYNRHPDLFWWWKRYKGSMNQDVWIYDFNEKNFNRITDYDGNDSWPMWKDGAIYFVSDRNNDVANIFVYDLAGSQIRQVTDFEKRGVTWPSMSPDGTHIVFERDARLYDLDTGTEDLREVVVHAPADYHIDMVSFINPLDYVRSFDISPTGKRLAIEARGDIYTAPAEHGDVRNLTQSSGARDSGPSWSPDGKWVAYVSDKSGDDEIYLIDQMGKADEVQLTKGGHFKNGVMWSPDSDKLLYTTDDKALYLLDVDKKKSKLVAKNEHREILTYFWAPDGKWFAYDFARRNRNRDVFIYDVEKDKHHQITHDYGDDYEPTFTPDGKYLLLITERMGGMPVLARISLLPEEEEPFQHEDDEETGEEEDEDDEENDEDKDNDNDNDNDNDEKKKGRKSKGKKKDEKEKVEVKIDFEDIEGRLRRVPRTGGRNLHNVQATDDYYYYMIAGRAMMFFRTHDLYAFNVEKLKTEKIISNIMTYGLSADRKKLAYYDGKDFAIIKTGKKVSSKSSSSGSSDSKKGGKLNIKRKTSMRLDRAAEWNQIFNEGWRVVKYHFYDPNLHGVDWDEVKAYYEGLLPYVRTRGELNLLMTEMVGELNASHQGVRGGDSGAKLDRASLAYPGARLVRDEKTGYPRFVKIYKGSKVHIRYRAPLDADYVEIEEGDYLLAIDGHRLEPGENFYQYLLAKTRNKVTITTNDKPDIKGAKETRYKPIGFERTLIYKDWVDVNREYVEEKSDDKIGYMHLQNMQATGWREFEEKFEKYRYKDAIVIDVRYNGGGNIDERIIDYLERRPYHVTRNRNESPIERPDEGFYGEVVVMINEYSFSDAEVFPSAVKERGLGTLIGVPTLGYVIAVRSHPLIDGGSIRKTFQGIWEMDSGDMLESRGVEPDILVESPPEMEMAGRDVQLERAIEFLLEKIAQKPRKYDYDTGIDER